MTRPLEECELAALRQALWLCHGPDRAKPLTYIARMAGIVHTPGELKHLLATLTLRGLPIGVDGVGRYFTVDSVEALNHALTSIRARASFWSEWATNLERAYYVRETHE
jgi:hypothetical protein